MPRGAPPRRVSGVSRRLQKLVRRLHVQPLVNSLQTRCTSKASSPKALQASRLAGCRGWAPLSKPADELSHLEGGFAQRVERQQPRRVPRVCDRDGARRRVHVQGDQRRRQTPPGMARQPPVLQPLEPRRLQQQAFGLNPLVLWPIESYYL